MNSAGLRAKNDNIGVVLTRHLRSLSAVFLVGVVVCPFPCWAGPTRERVGSPNEARHSDALTSATGFVEVTAAAGLSMERRMSIGSPIWGDLDGDGFLDLFISRHFGGYSLYRNNRDGTFTDWRVLDFEDPNVDLHVGAFGDFNNDGYLDLYLSYGAKGGELVGIKRDQLYSFVPRRGVVNVLPFLGVENQFGAAQSVSLVDFDSDGFLDIFVMNRFDSNKFYRNENGRNLIDVAQEYGLDDPDKQLGEYSAWSDYDRDGDMDLLLARASLRLERNDGGTLVDATDVANLPRFPFTEGIAWGDYNNDGWVDLLLTRCGFDSSALSNRLFRNNGDGAFSDVSQESGVNGVTVFHHGAAWGDYDNDGDLDLFLVNGGVFLRVLVINGLDTLYRNNGNGTFTDVTIEEGLTTVVKGSGDGAAWGDYNNDGFLDLVVNNGKLWGKFYPEGRDVLYQNLGNDNHWVKIVPRGTVSNAAGIGVKVFVTTGDGTQFRELVSGDGGKLRSQGHGPIHFGLGDVTNIDTLVIEWPSGIREEYENLDVDKTIIAVEQSGLTSK
jgi:hypothetical protein